MITKEHLAAFNAIMNGLSGMLLVLGFLYIRNLRIRAHATCMVAALCTSAIFLVSYLYSQWMFKDRSSHLDPGLLRTFYFILLASHVILAAGMLPPIAITVWRAYKRQFPEHRKIARWTIWIWLYVSVTGVVVYVMLYHVFPRLTGQ